MEGQRVFEAKRTSGNAVAVAWREEAVALEREEGSKLFAFFFLGVVPSRLYVIFFFCLNVCMCVCVCANVHISNIYSLETKQLW